MEYAWAGWYTSIRVVRMRQRADDERCAFADHGFMTSALLMAPAIQRPRAAIVFRGVSKSFGAVRAVDDVHLTIGAGEVVALLVPNGAGKSTSVAMMLGLTAPDRGSVEVAGRSPRAAVAAGRIAAMLQDAGLMPGVTVAELLGLSRRAYPDPLDVGTVLRLAGIAELAHRRVDRLSGGQAQRVRFGLAAVADPDILLLDEPTTAMDVAGRQDFWRAMRAYAGRGHTVVFATHYLDEVEDNADRVVVMVAGRIVADGTPAAAHPDNDGTYPPGRSHQDTRPGRLHPQIPTLKPGRPQAQSMILLVGKAP